MARSRRGGGMGARRAPAAAPRRAPPSRPVSTSARTPAPAASTSTPAPMQAAKPSGGGMFSGIGSTIAQGMAFGTGSAVAHQAVGAAVGAFSGGSGSSSDQQQAAAPEASQQPMTAASAVDNNGVCANDKQLFFDCLKTNSGDAQSCNFLYEQLQQCQNSSTQMSFQ